MMEREREHEFVNFSQVWRNYSATDFNFKTFTWQNGQHCSLQCTQNVKKEALRTYLCIDVFYLKCYSYLFSKDDFCREILKSQLKQDPVRYDKHVHMNYSAARK
jgi:hypothetical protein